MKKFWLLLLLLVAACAPVQEGAERAVRAVGAGDDPATLSIQIDGVTFDPVEGTALAVVLYVGGVGLQEAEDDCEPLRNGIVCDLGDLDSPTVVGVTGEDRSANVSFYRDGRVAPVFFYARE